MRERERDERLLWLYFVWFEENMSKKAGLFKILGWKSAKQGGLTMGPRFYGLTGMFVPS